MSRAWLALLAVALAGCNITSQLADPRSINVEAGATPASASLSPAIDSLVRQTGPSYVTLIVHEGEKAGAKSSDLLPEALTSGSGFFVDGDGLVMTAGHVAVRKGSRVDARGNDGRLHRGKVVALRRSPDMALIRISDFKGPPVQPVSSPCLRTGAAIYSLGKPHAQGDTARIGEVASMSFGRPVTYNGFGYPDAMVLRMSTKKGESGGPVFDSTGRLAGMLVSTLSDGNGRALNLAHALPASDLGKFLCSATSCSSSWRALANASTKSCS